MAPQKTQAERLAEANRIAGLASNDLTIKDLQLRKDAERWIRAANRIGSAFKNAELKHKEVLKEQEASDALDNQMLFSVLSLATSGALSWISSAVQRASAEIQRRLASAERRLEKVRAMPASPSRTNFLKLAEDHVKRLKGKQSPVGMIVEAAEDTVQGAMGEATGTIAPMLTAPDLQAAVDQDPQVYQNELVDKLSKAKELALDAFIKTRKEWQNKGDSVSGYLDYWENYDLKAEREKAADWEKEAKKIPGDDQLPELEEIQKILEIGIWAEYIKVRSTHFIKIPGTWGPGIYSMRYLGDEIVKHLHELGITEEAGIPESTYKGVTGSITSRAYWFNGGGPQGIPLVRVAVAQLLLSWARRYKSPDLIGRKNARDAAVKQLKAYRAPGFRT